MRGLIQIGLTILMAGASLPAFAQLPREPLTVRVVATDFVLQGKIDKLKELAADSHVVLSRAALSMPDLEADPPDLLILDTPRPADLSAVQRALGETLFGNEPGDYGTGVSQLTLDSTSWKEESELAQQFLSRLQYAYGTGSWGEKVDGQNLFAEQLKGVQAAVMARSSELNGVLATDHPFEFLGGLSLAIRHLDGTSPSLYISDLRKREPRTTGAAGYLASELRSRYLNPQWIAAMQQEGYAGTLEVLNVANNLWGWQAADRSMVRADQWQALHDTFVKDQRALGVNEWFETHNPTAQAQLIERMVEAIRKGYWDAPAQTRRELAERWQALTTERGADAGEPVTREFIQQLASGFGLAPTPAQSPTESASSGAPEAGETVRGQVMQPLSEPTGEHDRLPLLLGASALLLLLLLGAGHQQRANRRITVLP